VKLDKNTATAAGIVAALWLMWRSSRPFSWPLRGKPKLLRGFGVLAMPNRPDRWHTGVDLEAPTGTPVYAAAAGTVSRVERWGVAPTLPNNEDTTTGSLKDDWSYGLHRGMGLVVEIDHGGYRSRYCHLSLITVAEGQTVQRGEQLGLTGETGHAGTPRLHWEVRRADLGGRPVDPLELVRG
jgi:murein DD-endopeptidase MepM/ murein hydrolase activator NlpD